MSLVIYVAHSGTRSVADPAQVSSLDALKAWMHKTAQIAPAKQIFLTNKGRSVRAQTLLTESEIYVFDATLFSPNNTQTCLVPDLTPISPGTPPDLGANQDQLQSWRDLFRHRSEWATGLRSQFASLVDAIQRYQQEKDIIEHSVSVAVMSLQFHMQSTHQKYQREEEWADALLKEQEAHIDNWERDLDRLHRIPAIPDFARYIQPHNASNLLDSTTSHDVTLEDFIKVDLVNEAAATAQSTMTRFAQRVIDLQTSLNSTSKQTEDLAQAIQTIQNSRVDEGDEAPKLMHEFDVVVKKLESDSSHVKSMDDTPQSIARATKLGLLQTRNYLPHMDEFCLELNQFVQRHVRERNTAAENFVHHMQAVSSIESRLAQIHGHLKNLGLTQDDQLAFDTLNVLAKLPSVYGSLMIEAVRRREWADKMKADSATLAEEMATYQEEEDRRRTKWLRSVDDVVKTEAVEGIPLGVEVNLQADELDWPVVQRQNLQDYMKVLTELDLPEDEIHTLTNAIKDLDRPTKKQIKHAKTFKNGSMHEAAFGTTSLMLRGEDEYKVLKEANTKLEEELRGQKSRVRRLEDILHRQTSVSRASNGDAFRPSIELVSDMITPQSPRAPEEFVRQTGGSRRTSLAAEDGKLANRLIALEAELQATKDRASTLEKDASIREQQDMEGRREIEDAVSTKKDIMQNMEAQQKEFADERRILEHDLESARNRIEELEDELDRILGSRDQERSGIDARTRTLETELEKMKTTAEEAELRYQTELDEVRGSLRTQQDENQHLREELAVAKRDREEAERAAQTAVHEQQKDLTEQSAALTTAYRYLSPTTSPPEKYVDLASALERLSRKSVDHVKELVDAIALAKSDVDALRSQSSNRDSELKTAKAKQSVSEAEIIRLQDDMEAEKAHAVSLARCLEDEREQLRSLRSKFADGETGVDALRQRVAEEEGRVAKLSSQLADAEAHSASLDLEITRARKKLNTAMSAADAAEDRLKQRGVRAKEIAQRLYAQNARLLRLLEALGFVVTNKDGNMVIERASRANASTTLDMTASLNRTISMSSPPPTRKASVVPDDPSSLTFLHWTEASNAADEESQYSDYMEHISLFSIDAFSEAISKRLRDFEYTARKWQKEARSCKEKYVRLQADSSAKIAVRDFKEGDLALFLPTKGQRAGAWAAFNINAPHHFLHEREGMVLSRREWLVARITKIEERVVDLSKPPQSSDGRSIGSTSVDAASLEEINDNPFDLSDGLTWYMVHATEDKPGAPTTPGLGKSTVASSSVDARGSIRLKKQSDSEAAKTLNKSLDSRRSSSNSKKGMAAGFLGAQVEAARRGESAEDVTRIRQSSERGLVIDNTASTAATSSPQDQAQSLSSSIPRMTMPPPSSAPQSVRSTSPSKSIRSLARHLQEPTLPSPNKQTPLLSTSKKVEVSPRKQKGGDNDADDKKKGLWNLFNAEYEV